MRGIVHGPGSLDRHLEIFFDRQIRKDAAAFRNIADAEIGDPVRRPVRGGMAENAHRAVARMGQTDQAAQRRRFAGAVAAEQCDDLALPHLQADAVQDVALAVIGVEAFRLEHDAAHAATFPKYAACTASLAAISGGVPSARNLP